MRHLPLALVGGVLAMLLASREALPAPPLDAPLARGCISAVPPAANATYASDHPATVSLIPNGFTLQKSCDAYKTYGGYDVAYTAQTATWTFTVPPVKYRTARVVLSMIADDHATPSADYHYRVWLDRCAYEDPVPLPHGLPAAAPFSNWITVTIPLEVPPGPTFSVSVTNDPRNALGPLDWIAIRSVQLELITQ